MSKSKIDRCNHFPTKNSLKIIDFLTLPAPLIYYIKCNICNIYSTILAPKIYHFYFSIAVPLSTLLLYLILSETTHTTRSVLATSNHVEWLEK